MTDTIENLEGFFAQQEPTDGPKAEREFVRKCRLNYSLLGRNNIDYYVALVIAIILE